MVPASFYNSSLTTVKGLEPEKRGLRAKIIFFFDFRFYQFSFMCEKIDIHDYANIDLP